MHVDNGSGSVMNPVTGETWGSRSRAETLPFQSVLGSFSSPNNYSWAAFNTLKSAHFDSNRLPAFHYLISANRYGAATNGSSGISRGLGASDFIVSLGTACSPEGSCPGTTSQQAGTFMHEFGHNLGLHHNGNDDNNFNPDYLSIMNYLFQFIGIPAAGSTSTSMTTTLDYSRYADGALALLDESDLDENAGMQVPAGSAALSRTSMRRCPNATNRLTPLTGAVDFDCDGNLSSSIATDLSADGSQTTLRSYDDWPNIQLKGGSIGGFGLDPLQPVATFSDEPTVTQLNAIVEQVTTAPTVTTDDATAITSSTATIAGTVNPNGTPTRYSFQLGTATTYGTTSPSSAAGAGTDAVIGSSVLSDLAPDTTYHYRIVAETDRQFAYGADRTFKTARAATDPGVSTPAATQPTPNANTPISQQQQSKAVAPIKPKAAKKKPCAGLKGKKRTACLRQRILATALRKCNARKAGKPRNRCKAAARRKYGPKRP